MYSQWQHRNRNRHAAPSPAIQPRAPSVPVTSARPPLQAFPPCSPFAPAASPPLGLLRAQTWNVLPPLCVVWTTRFQVESPQSRAHLSPFSLFMVLITTSDWLINLLIDYLPPTNTHTHFWKISPTKTVALPTSCPAVSLAKAMSAQAFFQGPLVAAQASGPPQPSCSHSGS